MTDLRTFILKRQAEIETASKPALARFAALQNEMNEVRPKIEAFRTEWMELQVALKAIGAGSDQQQPSQNSTTAPTVTIKEAILAVLAKHPTGLSSAAILDQINRDYFSGDNRIVRTSFSPQLSRLKADQQILLEGYNYILNSQKQPAETSPSLFRRI
jgi:hypothetical protein